MGLHSKLHLVGPLSFSLEDKYVKRAGLDYWPNLDLTVYENWDDWYSQVSDPSRIFYLSTKAKKSIFDLQVQKGDWFVFGKETKGLDLKILEPNWERVYKLPFPGKIRSFNVGNAVAMVLGEGYRQISVKP